MRPEGTSGCVFLTGVGLNNNVMCLQVCSVVGNTTPSEAMEIIFYNRGLLSFSFSFFLSVVLCCIV